MTEAPIKVLLVAGSEDDYTATHSLLEEASSSVFRVEWVRTYDKGIESLRQNYDVCLFDSRPGERHGIELLREAVLLGVRTPIILLSSLADRSLDVEAIKAGAADYLVKGRLDAAVLERSIRYAVERRRTEEQISRLAYHDTLTGLPNRMLFCDRVERMIASTKRHGGVSAILMLDLDNFKRINDTMGHYFGDALLQQVAERLTRLLRRSDAVCRDTTGENPFTVARLGGDEFTILLEEVRREEDGARVAHRLLSGLSEPFSVKGQDLFLTISIGIALYPADGEDIETLIRNADAAMYHAKAQGKNNFQFYRETMNAQAMKRFSLESALHRALEKNELQLHYQPLIDLRRGKVNGFEALLRWNSGELGMISPADFIPIAEETGLIIPIGAWVIRTACAACRQWRDAGFRHVTVSVNLSPKQFRRPDLPEIIAEALAQNGLPVDAIDLEITETVMMDADPAVAAVIERLREMGLCFSIDDFGTGYSSLAYLRKLPVDTLKVDRSFITDLADGNDASAIVTAIVAMAHSLRLHVVAEGVETEAQRENLMSVGCDLVQGYLLGRPMPFHQVLEYLESRV